MRMWGQREPETETETETESEGRSKGKSLHSKFQHTLSACLLLPRSGNAIGPEGGKALAVPLEHLTALQQLDLRCSMKLMS